MKADETLQSSSHSVYFNNNRSVAYGFLLRHVILSTMAQGDHYKFPVLKEN